MSAWIAAAGLAVAIGGTVYGAKTQAAAQTEAKKRLKLAEQSPRQRIDYINTKLLPAAQKALTKAQTSGNQTKIGSAQNKIADLQDEAALLAQVAADQHAEASGLFTDINAPAESRLALPDGKKMLLLGGVGLAVVAVAVIAARRKRA